MKKIKILWVITVSILVFSCQKSDDTTASAKDFDIEFSFDYLAGRDTRPLMTCDAYTKQEADNLDKALKQDINKAPNKRGKVVTAATFLVSLDYAVPYGFEFRTKTQEGPSYEYVGRFTREGLHLQRFTDEKGEHLPWGCLIKTHKNYPRENVQNLGDTYENGLQCSSFVGWCLFNGGAVQDLNLLEKTYANEYRTFPSSTEISLKEGIDAIRAGDLLWFSGHIAIVIGVKDDIVVYASAEGGKAHPGRGIRWLTFNKKTTNFDTFMYKSLIQMNNVYGD